MSQTNVFVVSLLYPYISFYRDDKVSDWAFAKYEKALELGYIESEIEYKFATRISSTAEYIHLHMVKSRIRRARSNMDILRDFRKVFVNALHYYWDPINPYRTYAWKMLSELDGAISRSNQLMTSLLQEGLRFRPFGNSFPGATPVFFAIERFYKENRNDAFHLYYNDGYYHPEDNYEDPEDYKDFIKDPRFLVDIFTNLAERKYKSFDAVYEDVILVFKNAITYFGGDSGNGERSVRLKDKFIQVWTEALPHIRKSAELAVNDGLQHSASLLNPDSLGATLSSQSRTGNQTLNSSAPGLFKLKLKTSKVGSDSMETSLTSSGISSSRSQLSDTQSSQIPSLPKTILSAVPGVVPQLSTTVVPMAEETDTAASNIVQQSAVTETSSVVQPKSKLKLKFGSALPSHSSNTGGGQVSDHAMNDVQERIQSPSSVHNTRHAYVERLSPPPSKRQKVQLLEVPTTPNEIKERMLQMLNKLQAGVKVTRPSTSLQPKGQKSGSDIVNLTHNFNLDPTPLAQPDYTSQISQPMWLQRVVSKFRNNDYATPEDLRRDLDLIGTNCLTYNSGNELWEWRAREWLRIVDRQYRRHFLGEKGSNRRFAASAVSDTESGAIGSEDKDQSETDSDSASISDTNVGTLGFISSSINASTVIADVNPVHASSADVAPQFADDNMADIDAALPRIYLFDSLFDEYDIIRDRSTHDTLSSSRLVSSRSRNDNLEQGVRPLCESLLRRIRKTAVVRRVVDQLKRAHNDPRYAPVASKLVLPELMKREGSSEFQDDEGDETGQYGQILSFTTSTKISTIGRIQAKLQATGEQAAADSKIADKAQRAVHLQMLRSLPPPYKTIGSLFRDLFGMFEVAIRIHSHEAWDDAGVLSLHDESIEQRSSLAVIAFEFVKALSNEFFAHIVKEEAAKQIQMRLEASKFVSNTLVSVSSRASLVEAIKMITSNPFLRDSAKHFSRPVQILFPNLPSNYWKTITHPMDFGTIEERLSADKDNDENARGSLSSTATATSVVNSSHSVKNIFYKTHADFAADIETTLTNAIDYNSKGTGDKNILQAAKILQREWREVVWPECCVYSRLALRTDVVEASALRRAQEKDERQQIEARKKLEAVALFNGVARVVRDADVWIDRAVNAVSGGHLEDVPVDISVFATSASGGLNRNSAIATFAARNIDEEPGRAAAIIANELRDAEAKTVTKPSISSGTLISSKVMRDLKSVPVESVIVGHNARLLMQSVPVTSEQRTLLLNSAEATTAPGTKSFFLLRQLGLL